ncbi:MAG: hypothetical protein K2O70_05450 [Desulfovibrionaceae bacterium]|nr:hypothetical protein [Desulfovibrionaceae bacterium]
MATINVRGEEVWKRIRERLGKKALVRAGILEDATNGETKEPIAPYAAANEYGTANIPPRPFLRQTYKTCNRAWIDGLARMLRENRSPDAALKLTGRRMAEDIQATIRSNMQPSNSTATSLAKAKKVDGGESGETMTPGTLIDTGSMLRAIDYEVAE